jgi:hypothetical protein
MRLAKSDVFATDPSVDLHVVRKPEIGDPPSSTGTTVTAILPAVTTTLEIAGAVGTRTVAPAGPSEGSPMQTAATAASSTR